MTQEELVTAVKELESLVNTGKNYVHAETQARLLLATEDIINQPGLHCKVQIALSQSLWRRGLSQEALPHAEYSLILAEQKQSKELQGKALSSIGIVHELLSDYPKALEYYSKALALYEEIGNKSGIASNLGNCGIVYELLSDYSKALEYYGKAHDLNEELGIKDGIASMLGNCGNVYTVLSDYPKALEYYGKALDLYEELSLKSGIAINLCNCGIVYQNLLDYPKALDHYSQSLALFEELGSKDGIASNLCNCGIVYAKKEFEGYDPVKAEEYMLKSLAVFKEIGAKSSLFEIHQGLAELYEEQERWKEHSFHYKRYHELKEEVQSEEAKKKAEQLDYERKTAEREKQLAIERALNEQRERVIGELTLLNASLEEANREKNEVIGIVAHDLKNPLTGILLTAENIRRYSEQLSRHDIVVQVQKIASTADRMKTIVMNLLDIQRIESDGFRLDIAPISVKAVFEECIAEYVAQASAKNISIKASISPKECIILADSTAVQEVMDNLLSNAVKFSPSGSQIFAELTDIPDDFVRISIKDQGPGLTNDDLAKVFGKFMRLSAKPTGGEHSTGLGLSIVKKLVETMGGRIRCESTAGEGAAFIVEFQRYFLTT